MHNQTKSFIFGSNLWKMKKKRFQASFLILMRLYLICSKIKFIMETLLKSNTDPLLSHLQSLQRNHLPNNCWARCCRNINNFSVYLVYSLVQMKKKRNTRQSLSLLARHFITFRNIFIKVCNKKTQRTQAAKSMKAK